MLYRCTSLFCKNHQSSIHNRHNRLLVPLNQIQYSKVQRSLYELSAQKFTRKKPYKSSERLFYTNIKGSYLGTLYLGKLSMFFEIKKLGTASVKHSTYHNQTSCYKVCRNRLRFDQNQKNSSYNKLILSNRKQNWIDNSNNNGRSK